jgi:hypothetical protein
MQSTIVAGDTLNYRAVLADYPASAGWTLKLRLVPRGTGTPITITATPDGDDYLVQKAAADTASWTPGEYSWHYYVEQGAERYPADRGQLTVRPDPATMSAGVDTRTAAEIALDNVRATIRGTTSTGVLSYTINGRELRRYGVEELLALETKLATDVERERSAAALAAGRPSARKVYVRMGRA